jgi:hypothetical protein
MAENELKNIVYSKNVIEFVTIANEFCAFAERTTELEKDNFIDKSLKFFSLLYLKTMLLPTLEKINEEENEKFVTEFDYQFIKNGIAVLLGDNDTYLDFFDEDMNETPEPVTKSISENMADIYQDLKDFLGIYQLGVEELSNDAITECKQSFENYWGFRLVNSIRILHQLHYQLKTDNLPDVSKTQAKRDIENWFINRAQRDFKANA